jgi:hypothetical protein
MLHVDESNHAVVLFAEVDAHHLRLDDLEAMLRAMESVVVEAAGGD